MFSSTDSVVMLGLVFALNICHMRSKNKTEHMSVCQGGTPPDYAAFKGSVHEHVALAVDDKGHGLGTVLAANLFKAQRGWDLKMPKC